VKQGTRTGSYIGDAGRIAEERLKTIGCVEIAGVIAEERLKPGSDIVAACCVALKRGATGRRVRRTGAVGEEGKRSIGCIGATSGAA